MTSTVLHILHGENQAASRNALVALIARLRQAMPNAEVLRLDGLALTDAELTLALESQSLFGQEKIIQIDGFLGRKPSKDKSRMLLAMIAFLDTDDVAGGLILWEHSAIQPAGLKSFAQRRDCRISEFKLSSSLFKFLDSLSPGQGKRSWELLTATAETEPIELLLFMLARRITQLLLVLSGQQMALEGVNSPWQKAILQRQAANWTEDKLLDIHRRLVEIDESVKTGASPADLFSHLEILLLSL